MTGSYFYLWTKANWDYTQVYQSFYKRAINRFNKRRRDFDEEKEQALEQYIHKIEEHLREFESSN